MTKNYELFIENNHETFYPFFLQNTGEYFHAPDECVEPKELCTLMFDEVSRLDKDLGEKIASMEIDYFIVRQFTPMDIAEYILTTFSWTYDPNEHEYFISYDIFNDKLDAFTCIKDGYDITVTCHVDYDEPYANDESCERFFEETESIYNENFMKVCAALAEELNANILDL